MTSSSNLYAPIIDTENCKIVQWLVKEGDVLEVGQAILRYEHVKQYKGKPSTATTELKYDQKQAKVVEILVHENDSCVSGQPIARLAETCHHDVVVGGVCAVCGADVTSSHSNAADTKRVAMVQGVPDLHISIEAAEELARADKKRLHDDKRLVLILDLDQTLIHATTALFVNDWLADPKCPYKDVYSFFIPGAPEKYFVKLRPNVLSFLETLQQYYELNIYSMGTRAYAMMVASILDPGRKYFVDRILSRDDGFDQNFKAPTLKSLFPCGDQMVVVLDDREDVWMGLPSLVRARPYHFFPGVQDVNPIPLDKTKPPEPSGTPDPAEEDTSHTATLQPLEDKPPMTSGQLDEVALKETLAGHVAGAETQQDDVVNTKEEVVETIDEEDEGDDRAHKRRRRSCDMRNAKKPVATRTMSAEELALVKPQVKSAVAAANKQQLDVSANNIKEWRAVGRDKAVAHIVACLASRDYASAVVQLRACRAAFVTSYYEETHTKKKCSPNESPADVPDKADVKAFGKHATQDVALLMHLLSKPMPVIVTPTPPIPADNDNTLKYLQAVLLKIHAAYYGGLPQAQGQPTAAKCLQAVRAETLSGCCIVFSGVVPNGQPPPTHSLWTKAELYGAVCVDNVEVGVTHLVAARPGTLKVAQARTTPGICIVHVDWLKDSLANWCRMDEQNYALGKVPVFNSLPVPESVREKSGALTGAPIDFSLMDMEVDEGSDRSSSSEEDSSPTNSKTGAKADVITADVEEETGEDDDDLENFLENTLGSHSSSNSDGDNDGDGDKDGDGDNDDDDDDDDDDDGESSGNDSYCDRNDVNDDDDAHVAGLGDSTIANGDSSDNTGERNKGRCSGDGE